MTPELYEHLRVLSTVLLSTKETLEDCIGDVTDHRSRDSKSPKLRPERLFFYYSVSQRLLRAPAKFVNPCAQATPDFLNKAARTASRNSELVFGASARVEQEVPKDMKDLTRAGWQVRRAYQSGHR